MSDGSVARTSKEKHLLCRAAGWLAEPEGESFASTHELITLLTDALKAHVPETPAFVGTDFATGADRTVWICPDCGITSYPCNHVKDMWERQRNTQKTSEQSP